MKLRLTILAAAILVASSSAVMAQSTGAPSTGELQAFNNFLDNHTQLAQQLAANPALVQNSQFLGNHPELQTFLTNHPYVRSSLESTPGQFMYNEGHYEWNRGGGPIATGAGIESQPLSRFDNGYLDQHPEVARQLGQNPMLVDNPQFLATHPGLDSYLAAHPGVRTELQTHPERFMTNEWRDDVYGQAGRYPGGVTGSRYPTGVNGAELQNFNRFLDSHPEVAQQLAANPNLVNNPQFLANHPELKGFLANHPYVRNSLDQRPGQFINREGHYEWNHNGGPIATGQGIGSQPLTRFDNGYLDEHPEVARQLGQNPMLADNPKFLATHPGLDSYMASHPGVRTELQSHPERFMSNEWRDDQYGRRNGAQGQYAHPDYQQRLANNPPRYYNNRPVNQPYEPVHPQPRTVQNEHHNYHKANPGS